MTDPRDDAFVRRAGASLDRSVDALDGHTRSRLAAARRHALTAGGRRSWRWPVLIAPAAALALAVVLAVGTLLRGPEFGTEPLPTLADNDLELLELLAVQDPDELADDPDFYLWVEEQLSTEGAVHAG
ncbi:MAG: hypothetical protein KDG52_09450 [Rhodocyclaceae bacterium]|nr:hypothetical protein [Rhodocyclaceae bacterium]